MRLLTQGNVKLGQAIFSWSIPAVTTCPGQTTVCRSICYACSGRFRMPAVKRRLQRNLKQSRRKNFVDRMTEEIRRSGVIVLRLHVSGDFFDVEYSSKWLAIMKRSPRVRFYGYTRSWRVPEIAEVLTKIAGLDCVRLWYSCDVETGLPEYVPSGVRLAYLQTDTAPLPNEAQLVFRTRNLRNLAALPVVCGNETLEGKRSGVTCGSCARCFQ